VDDHVLWGALPSEADARTLHALGVRAVVNTCEEYAGPEAYYARNGIEHLRLPTVDFQPPSLADVERAVAFMRRHARAGRQVYVHCKAGRGRSATVALCWLVAEKGLSPLEAQAVLNQCRPHVKGRLHERSVVQAFAERLAAGRAGPRERPRPPQEPA
jgi:atypical dual specificity phosphatase